MQYYQYNPASTRVTCWEEADAYINAGRNKNSHRKLSKQRTLLRSNDGEGEDIIFRLYETDIITYHRDGKFTLFHGGYTTRTTIWDMERHSPVHLVGVPGSSEGRGKWCGEWAIAHSSDPLTAPKVQKCRTCKGTGNGSWTCYEARSDYVWNDAGDAYTRFPITSCRHGHDDYHEMQGCRRCDGTGRADYGSKPIHAAFGYQDHVTVTADGRPVRPVEYWAELVAIFGSLR